MRSRRSLTLTVALLVALGACSQDPPSTSAPSSDETALSPTPVPSPTFIAYERGRIRPGAPSGGAPVALGEVLEATDRSAPFGVTLDVRASMPEALAEARPQRRFSGEGLLEATSGRAGVTFDMSEIPNSAGFYGHVEGEMSVLYQDDRFTLTFPLLQTALPDEEAWVAFEVDDLSLEHSLELGIGQLREVGLAAPQLAISLLGGGPSGLLPPGGYGKVDGTRVSEYSFDSDLAQAFDAAGPAVKPVLKTLLAKLKVERVPVLIWVDGDSVARKISWETSYLPAPGIGKELKLGVTVTLSRSAEAAHVEVPAPETVVVFEDELSS